MPDRDDRSALDSRRHDPGYGPWRLGALTLLAAAVVTGGVLLFGGSSGSEDAATTAPGVPISVPPLPAGAGPDDRAPGFALDLFDGSRFDFAAHVREDGRPLILNLWASWCGPCREEMPALDEAAEAHPEVLVLGVAVDDDPLAAQAFVEEIEVAYPTGFDAADRVGRAYPTPGLPATYVISGDGELLETVFGRLTAEDIEALIRTALAGQTG